MNNSTIEGLRAQRDALKEKAVMMCALSNAVSMSFRSPEGRSRVWLETKTRALYELQCDMEALIATIEALPKEGDGWILMTERLPEIDESVLVVTRYGSRMMVYWDGDYIRNSHDGSVIDPEDAENIIGWQPLPPPPKQEEVKHD